MNKTKKGFLTAGSIIAIVAACFGILVSILLFSFGVGLKEKHIVEIYKMDESAEYHENADGSYYIIDIDEETGEETILKESEIEIIVKIAKGFLIFASFVEVGLDIAIMIIAIKLLKATNKKEEKKGLTIALLVLSALTGEILTLAFMIVALCLKNKQKPVISDYQQITIE